MTDLAGPQRYGECNPVFQIVIRGIGDLELKLHNPLTNSVTQYAVVYSFLQHQTQFIIGLHKFASGYAI